MPVCKPNSVCPRRRRRSRRVRGARSSIYGRPSPVASSGLPALQRWKPAFRRAAVSGVPLAVSGAGATLLGLAPRGVGRAACVAAGAGALLPHPCTLACAREPLPFVRVIGGLLSVARAVASARKHTSEHKRLPVRKHGALWRSDFPHRLQKLALLEERSDAPTGAPGLVEKVEGKRIIGENPSTCTLPLYTSMFSTVSS